HLHESEAARTPGLAVHHDAHARHRTVVLKQRAQFVLGSSKRQVTYKNTLQTISPWLPVRPAPPLAYTKLLMGAGPRSAAPSDPLMLDRAGRPTCPSPAELCLARDPARLRRATRLCSTGPGAPHAPARPSFAWRGTPSGFATRPPQPGPSLARVRRETHPKEGLFQIQFTHRYPGFLQDALGRLAQGIVGVEHHFLDAGVEDHFGALQAW